MWLQVSKYQFMEVRLVAFVTQSEGLLPYFLGCKFKGTALSGCKFKDTALSEQSARSLADHSARSLADQSTHFPCGHGARARLIRGSWRLFGRPTSPHPCGQRLTRTLILCRCVLRIRWVAEAGRRARASSLHSLVRGAVCLLSRHRRTRCDSDDGGGCMFGSRRGGHGVGGGRWRYYCAYGCIAAVRQCGRPDRCCQWT